MLQPNPSIINYEAGMADLTEVIKGKIIELSGTCLWVEAVDGYELCLRIKPDRRRNLRAAKVYADSSPARFEVRHGDLLVYLDPKNPPTKLSIKWDEFSRDYPDIFHSEIVNLPEGEFASCEKLDNNGSCVYWIYDVIGLEQNKELTIAPKAPLDYREKLVVTKGTPDGRLRVLFEGAPLELLSIPIEFSLDTLTYENFQIYLDWYNSKGECVTEIFSTEFIAQNYSSLLRELPLVTLEEEFEQIYQLPVKFETDLLDLKSSLDFKGKLRDSGVYIFLDFSNRAIPNIKEAIIRCSDRELELSVENWTKIRPGLCCFYIPKELSTPRKGTENFVSLTYDYGATQIKHIIELNKLFNDEDLS